MPAEAAIVFLIPMLPICIWVAVSDLRRMKIPNRAVLAALAVFAVLGPFVLDWGEYAGRCLHVAVVIVLGFLLNLVRLVGAGDAKFAAAMAPFVALADLFAFVQLLALVLIVVFALHRGLRAIGAVRRALPGWESMTRKDFPMGLALGPTLALYLGLAAAWGV
ncbi:prepilin peptidase [Roseicyclus sp. F158]|uniref:Prepilin peptidase n=1 Tax=Tropicimonas omnivorans TaxID=3075590 RepID=A0ABU3DF59_9RHOB|nr:prepilin peptidase [Roseicyclus sp. F158]MDT0682358.1 prepilin peptidase [Roseicyclus sp. F158]